MPNGLGDLDGPLCGALAAEAIPAISNLAYLINMDIHRATRSDPKSDVRRGKARAVL
jgi:hypothetical protein